MNHPTSPYFAKNSSLSDGPFGTRVSTNRGALPPQCFALSISTIFDTGDRNEEFDKVGLKPNKHYFDLRKRFIQRLMKDGKKSIATKLFDEGLEIFYQTIQQSNPDDLLKRSKGRKNSTVD
eukprot:SAG22_NODE_2_length_61565_cov_858.782010_25_plen_121_part_00